jgi:hypothetical protein
MISNYYIAMLNISWKKCWNHHVSGGKNVLLWAEGAHIITSLI